MRRNNISSTKKTRLNEDISAKEVRVIGADGEQVGILPIAEALRLALDNALDLVEIVPNSDPPVCRIMDFGKYKFQLTKKQKKQKKPSKEIKELKFRPVIGENDYQVKLDSLKRFLSQGHRVKLTLRFRGREMAHQELGLKLLQRVQAELGDTVTVEQHPKLEGRQLVMVVAPPRK
ncbi:MAG: translation initiation factor IF-3 [Gammaproteobacteria bacterium]